MQDFLDDMVYREEHSQALAREAASERSQALTPSFTDQVRDTKPVPAASNLQVQ